MTRNDSKPEMIRPLKSSSSTSVKLLLHLPQQQCMTSWNWCMADSNMKKYLVLWKYICLVFFFFACNLSVSVFQLLALMLSAILPDKLHLILRGLTWSSLPPRLLVRLETSLRGRSQQNRYFQEIERLEGES